jgi:hypothetical protein
VRRKDGADLGIGARPMNNRLTAFQKPASVNSCARQRNPTSAQDSRSSGYPHSGAEAML